MKVLEQVGTMAQGEVSEAAINILASQVIAKFPMRPRVRVVDVRKAAQTDAALEAAVVNLWPDGKMPETGSPGRRITFALIRAAGRNYGGKMLVYTPAGDQAYAIFHVATWTMNPVLNPTPKLLDGSVMGNGLREMQERKEAAAREEQLELNGHVEPPAVRLMQSGSADDEFRTLRREQAEMRSALDKRFVDVLHAIALLHVEASNTRTDLHALTAALGGVK